LKKNLVLTGMMGVGKSTIGKMLAKKLNLKFIDVDKYIEKKEKKKIDEIFKAKGENYFREIEEKITLEMIKKNDLIIALGGGAFVNTSIRSEIKKICVSFWLDLSLKLILPRLKNIKKRPLLNQGNLKETINKIYESRKKIYNESDFKINCNSRDTSKIINKITRLYENTGN
jgi:shikimate kinase